MTKTLYKLPVQHLRKIVEEYEANPAGGNSLDDMIRRTEYLLAKRMLSKEEQK
jgi:hypothetical protein